MAGAEDRSYICAFDVSTAFNKPRVQCKDIPTTQYISNHISNHSAGMTVQAHPPRSIEINDDRLVAADERVKFLLALQGRYLLTEGILFFAGVRTFEVVHAAIGACLNALAARVPVCRAHLQTAVDAVLSFMCIMAGSNLANIVARCSLLLCSAAGMVCKGLSSLGCSALLSPNPGLLGRVFRAYLTMLRNKLDGLEKALGFVHIPAHLQMKAAILLIGNELKHDMCRCAATVWDLDDTCHYSLHAAVPFYNVKGSDR